LIGTCSGRDGVTHPCNIPKCYFFPPRDLGGCEFCQTTAKADRDIKQSEMLFLPTVHTRASMGRWTVLRTASPGGYPEHRLVDPG
jgi:hypothetical protein